MQLAIVGIDVAWVCTRDGPTRPFYANERGVVEISVSPSLEDRRTIHLKIAGLKWHACRYELVGGIVLAIGLSGRTNLSPTGDGDPVWNLDTFPTNADSGTGLRTWPLVLLQKSSPEIQWHDGKPVPSETARVSLAKWSIFTVWDVTDTYRRLSRQIVDDIEDRTARIFRSNDLPILAGTDCRGFIRQSELRVDFPASAFPGNCIEECESNRISMQSWQTLVDLAASICGLDQSRLAPHLSDGMPTTQVGLDVMEALSTAVLGLAGVHVGYEDEQFDDTSVPWQKFGTNSDCEDFAIAAAALFWWLKQRECRFGDHGSPLARDLFRFMRDAFVEAKVFTGMVTARVARPDIKVTSDDISGHGWLMLRRDPKVFVGYPTQWALVECTAITLSYRPTPRVDPSMSMVAICNLVFDGILTIIPPHQAILELPSSVGCVTLLAYDSDMLPFKYKVAATMSDGQSEQALCALGTTNVGVPMADIMQNKYSAEPVCSDAATLMYDKYFRGFRFDVDFDSLQLKPVDARCIEGPASATPAAPLYGSIVYTAKDINNKMGGKFVVPDVDGLAMRKIETALGHLLVVGYQAVATIGDGRTCETPIGRANRVDHRLKRRLTTAAPLLSRPAAPPLSGWAIAAWPGRSTGDRGARFSLVTTRDEQ